MIENITGKVFVTRTQEQYDWMLGKLEEETDFRWLSGEKPTEADSNYFQGSDTILLIDDTFFSEDLMHGSLYYAKEGYGNREFVEVGTLMEEEENAPKYSVVVPDPDSPASTTVTCLRTDESGKVYISKVRKGNFYDNKGGQYRLTEKQIKKNHAYLWEFAEEEEEQEQLYEVIVEDDLGGGFYLRWSELWDTVAIEDLSDYNSRDITEMTEKQIKEFNKVLWGLAKPIK